MIRTPEPPPAPALPDWLEWMRLALADGLSMSGGLSLEVLFDRLEGRA